MDAIPRWSKTWPLLQTLHCSWLHTSGQQPKACSRADCSGFRDWQHMRILSKPEAQTSQSHWLTDYCTDWHTHTLIATPTPWLLHQHTDCYTNTLIVTPTRWLLHQHADCYTCTYWITVFSTQADVVAAKSCPGPGCGAFTLKCGCMEKVGRVECEGQDYCHNHACNHMSCSQCEFICMHGVSSP